MEWSANKVETLKEMWTEGASARDVAVELGFSRSAVCGKVHRLGLSSDGHPRIGANAGGRRALPGSPRTPPSLPPPPKEAPVPATLADGAVVTLINCTDRHCRFPLWDDGARAFPVCGNKPRAGSVYCDFHAALVAGAQRKPINAWS